MVVHQPDHITVVPFFQSNITVFVALACHVHSHADGAFFCGQIARGRGVAVVGACADGVPGDELARRVLGHACILPDNQIPSGIWRGRIS